LEVFDKFHRLSPEMYPDIDSFLDIKNEKRISVQSKLTCLLTSERHKSFRALLVGALVHHGAWFTSLQCPDAGRWVTVVPKHASFKFSNVQFQTLIRVRLFLEIVKLREGTICDCNRTPKVRVDKTCHHLLSGCGMQGLRHDQHDGVVLEISHMAGYCGLNVRREPIGIFHETEPDDGKKPDIIVLNPMISDLLPELDGTHPKLILDVMITNPVPGSQSGIYAPMTTGISRTVEHKANKAYKYKTDKYEKLAQDNGLSFLPLIFESTGRPHRDVVKFVKSMASDAAEVKKLSEDIIYGYVMNRVSCSLQKGLANTVNTRVCTLNGHMTRAANRGYAMSRDL
jgi:hypothetical protein